MTDNNLDNNPDYIPLNKMTDRQDWAMGYLGEVFYKAGRLFEESENKTSDAKIKLHEQGYSPDEIDPIIKHFNVAVHWINQQGEDMQKDVEDQIKKTIKQKLHQPPAPPKNT